MRGARQHFVIFAAEWDDLLAWRVAGKRGQSIGVQPAAGD